MTCSTVDRAEKPLDMAAKSFNGALFCAQMLCLSLLLGSYLQIIEIETWLTIGKENVFIMLF